MPSYLAHSANTDQQTHLLRDHLRNTCDRAASYAVYPWQVPLLRLAGILHDLGKYQDAFLRYLLEGGRRGSVPHARWGAKLARALGREDVSFAIDGHHAGLANFSTWKDVDHSQIRAYEEGHLALLVEAMLGDMGLSQQELWAVGQVEQVFSGRQDIVIRFLFSCLTDADWLDTEQHFAPEKQALRMAKIFDAEVFLSQVEQTLSSLATPEKPINQLRTRVRLEALEKAGLPTGFFSLNLPTGLGKTLTSFQWALMHARANTLQRIIIVLPYVNIIDQTASLLKSILGEEHVLEHHGSYTAAATGEQEDKKLLACENWDYPVIVTTSVQFYETLFARSPSKCRKLHNIANAVVILDEVQTLKSDLVLPTLDMLQDVQRAMNTSFVFCSATMPAFEKRETFAGIEQMVELVADADSLFAQTERVAFSMLNDLSPISRDTLNASIAASDASTLVVVNTKKLAKDLFVQAQTTGRWDQVFHLSTNMCPHHRKQWLGAIRAAIRNTRQRVLVVSTQLVEAGVDLDFPCVFRELAPLESIIQAAGRCNREGQLPHLGHVVLFQLENAVYPGSKFDDSYATQASHTGTLLKTHTGSIASHTFFANYYRQIHSLFVNEKQITPQRVGLNFEKVHEMYRIIESNTRPVFVVRYEDNGVPQALYERLSQKERLGIPLSREDFRAMQPYSVQVYDNFLRENHRMVEETKSGVLVWNGGYNRETGLDAEADYTDSLIL